ncbi:hypothetical protein M2399_004377 [Pseudomonas sp. BIGb0450]|uniref:hypothetical protein n=1 Tax=unclassified Pseudomonas TaxID=196821 RepID=UPI00216A64B5|nr:MULTISPECIES: hypothetical protein [unclassified Pseudomonas]MCS3419439.1 hypothetical protein [Pseudomonas sp. BIGb0558]MCS3438922.1 hypothetical protein [Pseudomonas sp. BIGb0450]
MGWDRQAPDRGEVPAPIVVSRWILAAVVAVLASVLLFLLYASERVPPLHAVNIWAVSGSPLLIWLLAFGARAYFYGGALSHQQFLEEEALVAQQAWQGWAQRYMAVCGSCVLLPDQVSASALAQGAVSFPNRSGQARRITALLIPHVRALTGLQLLLQALDATLLALPAGRALHVTLLSDVEPMHHLALRDAWKQSWVAVMGTPIPEKLTVTDELPYQWIDDILKTASPALQLILVLQVRGEVAYSDGLAALLLCPDRLASEWELPVQGRLLRPMPLDTTQLKNELTLFMQTQPIARQASSVLADDADWHPLTGDVAAISGHCGASLTAGQLWIQEYLWGRSGPFSHWLVAALGIEVARHQQRPLLLLTRDETRHWISTVTTGELA